MAEKLDPVISAVAAVHAALKDLGSDDRNRVLSSVQALLGLDAPGPLRTPPETPEQTIQPAPETAKSGRRLALIELMQEKTPSTNTQKIALFAYYRDRFEGKPRFARDDLKAYFAMAKEPPPANFDRDFVNAVRSGWVHEEGEDSYVTSKGIEVVESGFVGERKSTRPRRSSRKAKSGKATARKSAVKKSAGTRSRKKTTRGKSARKR